MYLYALHILLLTLLITPSEQKPTIVVVPGAWHQLYHYEEFFGVLNAANYTTHSMQLSCVGLENSLQETPVETVVEDFRQQVLLPLLDAGEDVIVVSHSFGGFVGGAAIHGLGIGERTSGGSVIGFLVFTGFPIRGGQTFTSISQGQLAPFVQSDDTEVITWVDGSNSVFYLELPDDEAAAASAQLEPQSYASFYTPLPADGFTSAAFDGRRAYIFALDDMAIPIDTQRAIVEGTGVDWIEREIEGGHSPHMVRPERLLALMEEAWGGWFDPEE